MIILAFKTKPTDLIEKVISWVTRSDIIHCEIVTDLHTNKFLGYTSQAGKGVVRHWVSYDPNLWEFMAIDVNGIVASDVRDFYIKTKGKGYDYLGCLGFVFGNPDNPNRYFCSEWCAECLGLKNCSSFSPSDLYKYFETLGGKEK